MVIVSILVAFSLLLTGCSSSSFNFFGEEEKLRAPKKVSLKDPGPSKTKFPSFIDQTGVYGLKDLKAMNFVVVDFDNDGFEDLIYLKNFYSEPEFLRFDPVKQKFVPHSSLFKSPVRASF